MSTRYGLVALLAFGLAFPVLAQESAAVLAAKQHLRSHTTATSLVGDDLADLRATDSYPDRRSGATMVYLVQQHQGIEVYGAIASVAVLPSGKTHGLTPRNYVTNLAQRVNATEPRVAAGGALATAEAHVRSYSAGPAPMGPKTLTDDPEADAAASAPVQFDASTPRLVYEQTASDGLRLAWATVLTSRSGVAQMWDIRVDALTGTILASEDLVARDRWHVEDGHAGHGHDHSHHGHAEHEAPVSFAPVASPASAAPLAHLQGGATYRVLPWPIESPDRGDFALVTDPADPIGSPNGWHDTGVQTFTTTRGNNIWAYPDRNDSESPDAVGVPQGGAGLNFDFVYDDTQNPQASVEAATVNLFYWGNVFHDVMYQYGFDEPAGNFQVNNFGNGGLGNDPARLEAQSGGQRCNDDPSGNPTRFACYGNANFATPSDGGSGRMQMYEWVGTPTFTLTAPAGIAGEEPVAPGLFGVPGEISGEVVRAETAAGTRSEGCTEADVANGAELNGKIALIQRGTCSFTFKARTAEAFGAIAVIVHNNERELPESPEDLVRMAISPDEADDINIPALFVQRSTGILIGAQTEPVMLDIVQPPRRDSDYDNGVIIHEYGHGISNRLTGGPSTGACLGNAEQMGEGWSDYYGLLFTMTEASDTPRAIAPYLTFEGPDGNGIRPAPYTRDMSVNPLTYQDVISGAGTTLSIPHGLGTVWSSMIWDMTLDLVDQHGFDVNVYDADGGSGNQIAMSLVTQGMKMQPCRPGFVDGRDAILEADTLLYGGANSQIIWAAFARRGLGVNATQGSSASANDGMADFSTPPVAGESGPNTDGARLSIVGANPARSTTSVALSLEAPEEVSIHVLDLLGRDVLTLHEGALAASTRHTFEVDASRLAPGVYVIRASGDTFSATRRVTIVR
ncbi:MAG: M36 family metallopeptidase [Bacteroidota bacterium]